jgi:hypothetical protein
MRKILRVVPRTSIVTGEVCRSYSSASVSSTMTLRRRLTRPCVGIGNGGALRNGSTRSSSTSSTGSAVLRWSWILSNHPLSGSRVLSKSTVRMEIKPGAYASRSSMEMSRFAHSSAISGPTCSRGTCCGFGLGMSWMSCRPWHGNPENAQGPIEIGTAVSNRKSSVSVSRTLIRTVTRVGPESLATISTLSA